MINQPSLLRESSKKGSATHVRLRVHIPQDYLREPIICQLISEYNLIVNITGAKLDINTDGQFDLELTGTPQQISNGLAYLDALNLKISGKPNAQGDSWNY